jgi:D-alanyl-lipoteichoic acid acyltransferase DltB (MBOAT superfamily)
MLFHSAAFIFVFMPVVLAGFFLIGRFHHKAAAGWLVAASLFFYGWWNPVYVLLLVGSAVFNFLVGCRLACLAARDSKSVQHWLWFGVAADLALLGYYKYANFFVDSVDSVAGTHWPSPQVVLPLGISFFTFTQIAFLVDARRGIAREYDFVHYSLFVSYFPHLLAGPVLHHKQMMPQFGRASTYRLSLENLCVGLSTFIVGLFKKLVLADGIADYAHAVFDAAGHGLTLGFLAGWCGAVAYALQIYFDFSGYTDMAIGMSRMLNIRLPLNFDSPYKARNIIDFWRRWHMTLSQFLRDYLYFSLGGNRKGKVRRYLNLMVTMLLGGLWHGAGWTFVVWGGLHGLYLVINHAWHHVAGRFGLRGSHPLLKLVAGPLTFLAVCFAWVYFRAPSLAIADAVALSMLGLQGGGQPVPGLLWSNALVSIGVGLAIVFLLPNTQTFIEEAPLASAAGGSAWRWRPNLRWALYVGALAAFSGYTVLWSQSTIHEFIYYRF